MTTHNMEKKFLYHIYLIRDLYIEYIKNYYNSIIKRQITHLNIQQKIWRDISPKKIYWQAHEKMLNIISRQRNANQSHDEIPLYIH